jgi:hypothetical protein
MQRFSVSLNRVGAYGASALSMPGDLILTPEMWSASDRGGCKQATISASGSAESLAYLCGWLGDQVEIYNEMGDVVWWGDLWEIEVQLGQIVVNLSLDNIYNRVAVTYPFILGDGSEESRTTDWVEDTISSDRYGKRELLYGLPATLGLSATAVRDLVLKRFAAPDPTVTTQVAREFGARLTAQGAWYKAQSIYFTNPDGLVEHTDSSGSIIIGMYMTSNLIEFGDVPPDDPSHEEGEMYITGGATFSPLKPGDTITVTGSVVVGEEGKRNNDTYDIEKMNDNTQIGITGSFVPEAAGPTIKISVGEGESQDYLAQGFTVATPWTLTHVAIQVRKVGNPVDNLRVSIYPDAGGIPGTFLSAIEIVGSTLYTESTWMEWPLTTPVALSAGTTYYLGVRRTGTPSMTAGYEVAIDDEGHYQGGSLRVYDGTNWLEIVTDPPGGADMPFRLIGEIHSTEQLRKALAVVPGFAGNLILVDSGLGVRQFRDEPRPALDEINEMLDAGTSDGKRLVASVLRDQGGGSSGTGTVVVDVQEEASYPSQNLILGADGRLHTATGSLLQPGQLIYGQYVDVESLMLLNSVGIRSARGPSIYIQESTYSAADDALNLMSEGAISPFDALKLRIG